MSVQRSVAPTVPSRLSGHVTNSGACPNCWLSWVLIWPAMSSLLTVSTMSKFTVPPLTLLTVTLTPSFCRLVVVVQSSVAPTVALRSSGQDTESGFYPDCWATFELIWSATSLLATMVAAPVDAGIRASREMRNAYSPRHRDRLSSPAALCVT